MFMVEKSNDVVCWWHMQDGRVLGVHDGQVIEYDAACLAPLGTLYVALVLTSPSYNSLSVAADYYHSARLANQDIIKLWSDRSLFGTPS